MMDGMYMLDEHGEPVPCDDLFDWAQFMEDQDARRVRGDYVTIEGGIVVLVSTVFLGLEHGYSTDASGNRRPILWETMVFGGPFGGGESRDYTQWQCRYASRADAIEGHREALAYVLMDAMLDSQGKAMHVSFDEESRAVPGVARVDL